ncbi:hypothetical protein [Streptomyces sp. NPDC057676]|uniref:hypothetical protein n=1 Tax=Streptomyces sp. NPDC057676 TaxID=3346205 RepID=UPI00368ED500
MGTANATIFPLASGRFAGFSCASRYPRRVLAHGPAATGLAFLPCCVGFTAGARRAGRPYGRTGARTLVLVGAVVGALGLLWFSRLGVDGPFLGAVLGPSPLTSLGIGACFVPPASPATTGVDVEEAGMASGVLNSAQRVGGSLGLTVTASAATRHTHPTGTPRLSDLTAGYGAGLFLAARLLAAAALLACLPPGRDRDHPPVAPGDGGPPGREGDGSGASPGPLARGRGRA